MRMSGTRLVLITAAGESQQRGDARFGAEPFPRRRWIFGQHAASVLLDGLQEGPFALVEALYELCITHGASTEVSFVSYLPLPTFR